MPEPAPRKDNPADYIRGLYSDLWLVTCHPFTAVYWRSQVAHERKRWRPGPLSGPIILSIMFQGVRS